MFRKSVLRLFRLISISFVQRENVMMIALCFLLFFHILSSCPIPSRVRIEKGLFEGLLLLIPCKVVSEKCHFETFIHFLLKKLSRTKNDQNRQDSVTLFSILLLVRLGRRGSLRIVGVWPCCSSLWPCSSSPSELLVCMVKLLYMQPLLGYVNGPLQQSSLELSGLPLS